MSDYDPISAMPTIKPRTCEVFYGGFPYLCHVLRPPIVIG
jgi:hypothetical protein